MGLSKEQQRDKIRQQANPFGLPDDPRKTVKRLVRGKVVFMTPEENRAYNRRNKRFKARIFKGYNTGS